VVGKNASSLGAITGALGGSGGSTLAASSLLSQAVAHPQPQTDQKSGEPEFNRARAACLTGKGYSVQ
jgi:hypothetical protein